MASPLLGIAGVNSLLFAAYAASKRVVSPFPDLSIQQIALAGGMAGAINAVLASPGERDVNSTRLRWSLNVYQSRCLKLGCKVNMVPRTISGFGTSPERCGENGASREG